MGCKFAVSMCSSESPNSSRRRGTVTLVLSHRGRRDAATFRALLDTRLRGYDGSVVGNGGVGAVRSGHPPLNGVAYAPFAPPSLRERVGLGLGLFVEIGDFG